MIGAGVLAPCGCPVVGVRSCRRCDLEDVPVAECAHETTTPILCTTCRRAAEATDA